MNKCRTCGSELAGYYHIDCEHACVESLKSQLDLAKVNERDLNEIITALNDELSEKESQLEEALKLAEEAIQHYEEADLYSEQFYYDVSVMLRDALKEQLKEKNNA